MNKPNLEKSRKSLKVLADYYHKIGNKGCFYAANTCIGLLDNNQIESDHFKYYYSFLERDSN